MRKQKHISTHHSLPVMKSRQAERCIRRFKRKLKKIKRACGYHCDCFAQTRKILANQEQQERLLEVIAMEINRQGEMQKLNSLPAATDQQS